MHAFLTLFLANVHIEGPMYTYLVYFELKINGIKRQHYINTRCLASKSA